MYSFDHDLEEFVSIGLGTVSADGSVIRSNPGVGVIKAGWHCGSQPGGSGCCTGVLGECQKQGPNCTILNLPTLPDTPGDCHRPLDCKTSVIDDSDIPQGNSGGCSKGVCDGGSPQIITLPPVPDSPGDCQKPKDCMSSVIDVSDLPADISGDCKKPACQNGIPNLVVDIDDKPTSNVLPDNYCKACDNSGSIVSDLSKNGTLLPNDTCKLCIDGLIKPAMSEIQGARFVCPGSFYQYQVAIYNEGVTAKWGGQVDSAGILAVPAGAVDGEVFVINASANSCMKVLKVQASDGIPGEISEPLNCIDDLYACATVNSLAKEAIAWALDNETALGGGASSGGCADAARHAYWSAAGALEIGESAMESFLNAHEHSNFNGCEDNNMDISNNSVGLSLGASCEKSDKVCVKKSALDALKRGDLIIFYNGRLVSSSVCKVSYK
jgi:hypothetical protein